MLTCTVDAAHLPVGSAHPSRAVAVGGAGQDRAHPQPGKSGQHQVVRWLLETVSLKELVAASARERQLPIARKHPKPVACALRGKMAACNWSMTFQGRLTGKGRTPQVSMSTTPANTRPMLPSARRTRHILPPAGHTRRMLPPSSEHITHAPSRQGPHRACSLPAGTTPRMLPPSREHMAHAPSLQGTHLACSLQ